MLDTTVVATFLGHSLVSFIPFHLCSITGMGYNKMCFHCSICWSTAEEDYTHLEERVEFGIEDLEKRVMVLIADNDILENVELFTATIVPIRGPFPVAVQNDNVTVIIRDNDCELITAG